MGKGFLKAKRAFRLAAMGLPASALATMALFFGSASPSYAHQAGSCSLATLHGQYIFADDGFQMVKGKKVPFADAGHETYDGHGHVFGEFSEGQGQSPQVLRQVHYQGTYTITPECFMTYTIKDSTGAVSHFDQFVEPSGRTFTFVGTDKGIVESGWEKQVTH